MTDKHIYPLKIYHSDGSVEYLSPKEARARFPKPALSLDFKHLPEGDVNPWPGVKKNMPDYE